MIVFLSSNKSVSKFAAIRNLSYLAQTFPEAVAAANVDLEALITNANRSIATFAITTILKTGNESSVDRIMKQLTGFMADITEEFKIVVIEAIRALCVKFPAKYAIMLSFLSNSLREEGGYEFKRAIVQTIIQLIRTVPDCKDAALSHLCEFIEDCEFTRLAVRILHILATHGPTASNPSRFIRFIYNRVILENAAVRSAAINALGRFAAVVPALRERIQILLRRCLQDVDDEARDRAIILLQILEQPEACTRYLLNGNGQSVEKKFPLLT